MGGLKPVRKLGRQESPLSRDTLVTAKEKDTQTTMLELTGSQTQSKATEAESKIRVVDSSTTLPSADVLKKNMSAAAGDTKSSPALVSSTTEAKPGLGDKPQNASSSNLEARVSKSKVSEKISTSKALTQDSKQQITQAESGPATKAQEKAEEKLKGTAGTDKGNTQKLSPAEQSKPRKGSETGEKGSGEKATETTKVKGPAPPVPTQVQSHAATQMPAATRSKIEKVSDSYRRAKEERSRLEVLEENPVSPSSTAASPCSSKSRPMSPGDKASFVTQLTSVAKTVLGPMKGSQEGSKVKDTSKSSEEKRGNTAGKPEASSGGGRRGAQTATSGSAGAVQSDKWGSRSSKHHS